MNGIWLLLGIAGLLVLVGAAVFLVLSRDKDPSQPDAAGGQRSEPFTQQEARAALTKGLESWMFKEDLNTFERNHPDIYFADTDWVIGHVLQEYSVNGVRRKGPADYEFSIVVTLQQVRGPGIKKNKLVVVTTGKRKFHIMSFQ